MSKIASGTGSLTGAHTSSHLRPVRSEISRLEDAKSQFRIDKLSMEIRVLSDRLSKLNLREKRSYLCSPLTNSPLSAHVREILRQRRRRSEVFPAELFADPAWDILLDLFLAELEQYRVSISSLCLAAAVPETTALRWIVKLEEEGMLAREPDKLDRRRTFVVLSRATSDKIHHFFADSPTPLI